MASHVVMGMLFPLSQLTLGNVSIKRQHSILFSFFLDTHQAFPLGVARVVYTQRSPKTQRRLEAQKPGGLSHSMHLCIRLSS